jgi:hypothetical protein
MKKFGRQTTIHIRGAVGHTFFGLLPVRAHERDLCCRMSRCGLPGGYKWPPATTVVAYCAVLRVFHHAVRSRRGDYTTAPLRWMPPTVLLPRRDPRWRGGCGPAAAKRLAPGREVHRPRPAQHRAASRLFLVRRVPKQYVERVPQMQDLAIDYCFLVHIDRALQ